jgi:hypothetical protein
MEKGCQRQGLQDNGIGFQERCKRVKVGQVYARGVGTLGMEKGCHGVARGGWQDNDIGFQDRCKSVWGGGGRVLQLLSTNLWHEANPGTGNAAEAISWLSSKNAHLSAIQPGESNFNCVPNGWFGQI